VGKKGLTRGGGPATARKEKAISGSPLYDPATGLPGRELFEDRLRRALARADRSRYLVALLCVDLAGPPDWLDRRAAERLEAYLRATDTVARYRSQGFSVIQTDLNHFDNAAFLAQKLLSALDRPDEAYIGIALYPDDDRAADGLIVKAEQAAALARAEGQRYRFHTAAVTAAARARVDLGRDLHQALPRKELVLHFQPKVDLVRRAIVGVEALLRWRHPVRGMVPPEEFLHIAEETELIVPIGEWALRRACVEGRSFVAAGDLPLRIAVNVAAEQLARPGFAAVVTGILDETGLDPRRLELEISERTIMEDTPAAGDALEELHRFGVEVAVDDFGTGYSSLSHLKLFPVDRLKIDKSFVAGLPDKRDDAAIVKGVIGLGHGLDLGVVAEGVDSKPQLDFLREAGCDQVQGYYYSLPLPAAEFGRLLERWVSCA